MKHFRSNKFHASMLMSRVRKHRLKYIAMLPSLITLFNAIFGFIAIILAGRGAAVENEYYFFHKPQLTYFALSGYMIFLAMIADMLDGRVARLSKSTSSFGGQLDSLCDVISFGVAPAFLMLKILDSKLIFFGDIHPALGGFVTKFVWLTAAAYVSCAAIRLARFNVENEEDESAHMAFSGLPSPAAAGVVTSIVVLHQDLLPDLVNRGDWLYNFCDNAILYTLPFLTLAAAILMVTRIRYPHFVNQFLRGKKPFQYLLYGLLTLMLFLWNLQLMLAISFCGFAFGGLIHWTINRHKYKTHPEEHEDESEETDDSEETENHDNA